MEPRGAYFVSLFVLSYIDCLIITFILKCKITIAPVKFYISVFIHIYLTPVQCKLIHKVSAPSFTQPLSNYN